MVYFQPDRYIRLLTDFGFKRVFDTEPNKRLLMNSLITLLPDYKASCSKLSSQCRRIERML
jgi:hypothetical protein